MSKVSLVKCQSYEYAYKSVREAIACSLNNVGGLSAYVSPGEKVLLKVNLVMKKEPEAAATSHPVFVQALADILIANGAQVVIGDSPGGLFTERALKATYKFCGMEAAAEKSGAALNYNTGSSQVGNPEGLILKKLTNTDMLRDVDKVFSVTKLKTHGMMKMTGAVKNLFGTIPGTMKAEFHLSWPETEVFADALIDVCLCAAPVLSFVDGIVAMEGDGPTAGTPKQTGVLLVSENPFELDYVQALIMGASPESMPTVRRSMERGLCPEKLAQIQLVGDGLDQFLDSGFITPTVRQIHWLRGRMPDFIVKILDPLISPKPVFNYKSCIGCGDCAANCPPQAIVMNNRKPQVNLSKCIRCFCCQELCPKEAVEIRRPFFFKLISR